MARLFKAGDSYRKSFTVTDGTGLALNADSLPAATLYVNGVPNGATVTVANSSAGVYTATATLPGAAGNVVELLVSALVGGILTKNFVDAIRLVGFDSTVANVAANVIQVNGVAAGQNDGQAQGGGSNYIDLAAGASTRDDAYKYWRVRLVGGTGGDGSQYGIVTGYTGSSRRAIIRGSWATQPDATTTYQLDPPDAADVELYLGTAPTGLPNTGNVTVGAYATGQDPATLVWSNASAPTRTITGTVTVGAYAGGQDPGTLAWAFTTRTLSSGANIVLSKGVGITGFNDITAAAVWGLARSGNQGTGSFGEYLDAAVSTRLPTSSYTPPDNTTLQHLGTTLQTDGLGGYQFTVTALSNAPGGAGGSADWSTTERAQIRYRLGLDGSTNTPAATPTLPATLAAGAIATATFAAGATLPRVSVADTVTDKAGYALTSGYDPAKTAAQAGDAMALTGAACTAAADALLDRASGVEPGETPRQWMRKVRAVLMGVCTAGGVFKRKDASTTSITVSLDGAGARTNVVDGSN